LEEGEKQINLLWKCNREDKERAVKWLLKIFRNILKSPDNTKFHSINFAKMMKLFRNARPGLHILFAAGFSQTVDGTKIQIKPSYINHLSQVLAMLEKKIAEPELEKEPTPPPQPKPKPVPVEKKEVVEAKVEAKPQPKPVQKLEHPEYMDYIGRGAAIVVLKNNDEAKKIVETLNGAQINEHSPIKVEFFSLNDDGGQPENSGLSIDSVDEDVEMSNMVRISGLFDNLKQTTLEDLIKKSASCTIKEVYYKMKVGRGAALGGGGTSEFDDIRSQIDSLKGTHTRIKTSDVAGKTKEEKARIIKEKQEQYRRDKVKIKFEEAKQKSANERRNRQAAFELKKAQEQHQFEEIIRQRKKKKERERREKERVRAKIKADKERRKREQQEREARKRNG